MMTSVIKFKPRRVGKGTLCRQFSSYQSHVLAVLKVRAKEDCRVGGIIPHLVGGGVSILPYSYDPIIFMLHNLGSAVNMKLILCILSNCRG